MIAQLMIVICQVYLSGVYISVVILPSQHLLYKLAFFATHPCGSDAKVWIFCPL